MLRKLGSLLSTDAMQPLHSVKINSLSDCLEAIFLAFIELTFSSKLTIFKELGLKKRLAKFVHNFECEVEINLKDDAK